jgi:hypothetical protein
MKCSKFETQWEQNQNIIPRWCKGPHRSYDVKSSAAAHGAGSQVFSQSSGSPLGHTYLPQQSQYSGVSAHNLIHKQGQSN